LPLRRAHPLAWPLLAAAAGLLTPGTATAAWPHDSGQNAMVCTASGDQYNPALVGDGSGGAIVVWQDYRNANSDIFAAHLLASGATDPAWTAQGVAVCAQPGDQLSPQLVSDGAGGAFIVWYDGRTGATDIYAQRVLATGAIAAGWPAGGLKVCGAAHDQTFPSICADGIGGAIFAWQDYRSGADANIVAQRVSAAGAPRWTVDGVTLCAAANEQTLPRVVADGLGGAIAVWRDLRNGADDNLYTRRISAAGTPMWTPDGVAVCTAASQQEYPVMIADGSGGAIMAWHDLRSGTDDIYAQRVSLGGAPQWAGNGVAVCTAANDQVYPTIASDNAGGAIVAWRDERNIGDPDIYAQRLNGAGVPLWTAQGVALCAAAGMQDAPAATEDGAGGAIVAWYDDRTASTDVYAQRVGAAGTMLWTANGAAVSTALQAQYYPAIAADQASGAIIAWYDFRPGANSDIYAQRIERFGQLGNPEPDIVAVRDAANDQGGQVSLQWTPSYLDQAPANPINEYWVWRQVPSTVALEAIARGAFATPESEGGDVLPQRAPRHRTTIEAGQTLFWEYLGSTPAHGFAGYSYLAATHSDSSASGNPYTRFMVEAQQTATGRFWDSAADSGYSVDNLAPATPAPFTGKYVAGGAALHWGQNGEPDFGVYRIHRGATAGFTPGPSNLIATRNDTGYVDVGPAGGYYKLAAVDLHGNASAFAVLAPAGTVDAPDRALATELRLEPAFPNPSSGVTRLGFALPRATALSLVIFDPQGRRVRELARGVLPAGEHALRWDGRDESGRPVASGPYFVRLATPERVLSGRLFRVR
jgi:hypothetical protein